MHTLASVSLLHLIIATSKPQCKQRKEALVGSYIPKPRGSEFPLWYPLNSGSLSVPQLLQEDYDCQILIEKDALWMISKWKATHLKYSLTVLTQL